MTAADHSRISCQSALTAVATLDGVCVCMYVHGAKTDEGAQRFYSAASVTCLKNTSTWIATYILYLYCTLRPTQRQKAFKLLIHHLSLYLLIVNSLLMSPEYDYGFFLTLNIIY